MKSEDYEMIDKCIERTAVSFDEIAKKIRKAGDRFKSTRDTENLEDVITAVTWGIANSQIETIYSKLIRFIIRESK